MAQLTITFDSNPNVAVESIYDNIKQLVSAGNLKAEHVEAIAELTTELANRLKVEEACGEQEG